MRVSNFLQSSQLALSLAELGTAQPQLFSIFSPKMKDNLRPVLTLFQGESVILKVVCCIGHFVCRADIGYI